MCGIAGWYLRGAAPVDEQVLKRMTRLLAHRGPDGEGIWMAPGIGLGHRRLAIRDLSPSGHQPALTAAGDIASSFNGEIYNDLQLRAELPREFKSELRGHCDAETLPWAFAAWGEDAFRRLQGMFAIALWSEPERALYLVRDPIGIKPLYYVDYGAGVVFASEVKSLVASGAWQPTVDAEKLHTFLAIGQSGPESTWYHDVKQVPPGSFVKFNDAGDVLTRYWTPERTGGITSMDDAVSGFLDLWHEDVYSHLVSDVPVAVLQSGGIDSTLVSMGLKGRRDITAFTASFGDRRYDETDLADSVVKAAGLEHKSVGVDADRDPIRTFRRMVWHSDGQCADTGMYPFWRLCEAVSEDYKVALTGDGGDEFFAGYDTYSASQLVSRMPGAVLAMPGWETLGKLAYRINARFDGRIPLTDVAARLLLGIACSGHAAHVEWRRLVHRFLCDTLYGPALTGIARTDPFLEYKAAAATERAALDTWLLADQRFHIHSILRKADSFSMAFGLELRVPLLDRSIMDFAGRIDANLLWDGGSQKKQVLRAVAQRLGTPESVLRAPKKGFNAPLPSLFRVQLREFAQHVLDDEAHALGDFFNPSSLQRLWREHAFGQANHAYALWPVLVFATSHRGLDAP